MPFPPRPSLYTKPSCQPQAPSLKATYPLRGPHEHLATDDMLAATVHQHLPYMLHDMLWSAADALLPATSASSASKTSQVLAAAPVSRGVGRGMKASGLLVVRQEMSQSRQMPQSSSGSGMAK